MSENDSSQEKTEEPTPRRVEKSREEGQVPRSKELNTTVLLMASAACIFMLGPFIANQFLALAKFNFSFDRQAAVDTLVAANHFSTSIKFMGLALLPLLILLFIAGVAGSLGVGGWNFSGKSLTPKMSKLNPFKGIKRMFSMNSLVELLKGWAKVLIVGGVAVLVLNIQLPKLAEMTKMPLASSIETAISILSWSFFIIASSTLLIALVDVPFQIYQNNKKLKMTMQEVKEEFKNTEGKPEVKGKIRQLQREMSQRRMMGDVPDADVVITNPEHFSVAIKYKHQEMAAPVLLAKGVDQVALKIREIANEYSIPIVPMPELARSLYHHSEIGDEIPEELYLSVAQVLAYIYQVDQWKAGAGDKPEKPDIKVPSDFQWSPNS